ncbi:response regulator [Rhizobium cauense]|uniref:response regulator transcription factor n=1 Tax=Rhizobium cauense TaxID=1166683 RepID=UPI001C6E07D4|nr:response regulator [Rhizobium cauense]MBW9113690.1 response regulator [Rhizobium cauense]
MAPADLIHSSEHPAATRRTAVLIADPDVGPTSPLVERLVQSGLHVCLADTADAAKRHLRERTVSFAIVELVLDDGDGLDLVEAIANSYPRCRTLVHSRFCNLSNAVSAIKSGASDVLPKPTDVDLLVGILLNKHANYLTLPPSFPAPNSIRHEHIREVYASCGSNVARAARQLSMHRRTLQRLLKRPPSL